MREPHNSKFVIVSFNKPVLWTRSDDEVWMFNPPRRYILNANQLGNLEPHIESISDLDNSALYKPLKAGCKLAGTRILVERYRERGLGDLLFLTGPFNYLRHVTGSDIAVDVYALADRGHVLMEHPAMRFKTTLAGPVHYDDLPLYDYHWMVPTVSEYDEEADQLNVYDVLYRQLGFEPASIDLRFKRPSVQLVDGDTKNLDQFMFYVYMERKVDLRKTGYYVVAPVANGSLRSAPYSFWIDVIREFSRRRPTIVVGQMHERVPPTDMEVGEFNNRLGQMGTNVINMLGMTRAVRVLMAIISKANCVACLDSGPLYIAQALRVPAISVWGPHDPMVRIGYDAEYMELAVWNRPACRYSPCFAYDRFPAHKCPSGEEQRVCPVLEMTEATEVTKKLEAVEARSYVLPPAKPGGVS